ncbi:hypothetical protein F2981_16375 [Sinorhizobium meliloti]|nr:hypothetical protein [Sinorhizobium meliloti]
MAASFTAAQLAAGSSPSATMARRLPPPPSGSVVEDGNEDNSAPTPATFNFTVNPVNDAPYAPAI